MVDFSFSLAPWCMLCDSEFIHLRSGIQDLIELDSYRRNFNNPAKANENWRRSWRRKSEKKSPTAIQLEHMGVPLGMGIGMGYRNKDGDGKQDADWSGKWAACMSSICTQVCPSSTQFGSVRFLAAFNLKCSMDLLPLCPPPDPSYPSSSYYHPTIPTFLACSCFWTF